MPRAPQPHVPHIFVATLPHRIFTFFALVLVKHNAADA